MKKFWKWTNQAELVCGDCGKLYGKKKWHSTDKYSKEIYRCNDKYNKSHEQCKTPILTEEQIKEKFIKAYNQVMCKKEMVIEDTLAAIDLLTNTDELELRIVEFQLQLEEISQKVSAMVKENARTAQDQIEFARKYDALTSEYEEVKNAYDKACKEKAYKTGKATKMRAYLEAMKQANTYLEEWSTEMWVLMVSKAIVNRDRSIKFEFMNGQEVTI